MNEGFPASVRQRALRLWLAGRSGGRIAAELGVAETTVYNWRWRFRWPPRENHPPKQPAPELRVHRRRCVDCGAQWDWNEDTAPVCPNVRCGSTQEVDW